MFSMSLGTCRVLGGLGPEEGKAVKKAPTVMSALDQYSLMRTPSPACTRRMSAFRGTME
jgi:hypothetical protein